MCTIRIGGERSEFLAIKILGRSHPDSRDFWDGNWVCGLRRGHRGRVSGQGRRPPAPRN